MIILTLYINILKWYCNRTHSHKISGTYYDMAYGTQDTNSARNLCKHVEGVDIDIIDREGQVSITITIEHE